MAIDPQPVTAKHNPAQTLVNGELAALSAVQERYFRAHNPTLIKMFGVNGSSTDGDSAIIAVAGRATMIVQAVGTGTFTCYGSLDGASWVSLGVATNAALTTLSSPAAFLKVTASASSGTYQVYLLAY